MKPPIAYFGGKFDLAKDLIQMFPKHLLYCEAFVGGGAVFWEKTKSQAEIINDKNEHIVNLYRVLSSDKIHELNKLLFQTPFARVDHIRAREIYRNPKEYTDIERAWAVFIHSAGFCHNNRICGPFAVGKLDHQRQLSFLNKKETLSKFAEGYRKRFDMCTIECDDAVKIIKRYDLATSFFYCDPPYPGTDQGHYGGYTFAHFSELLETLRGIKGKFMLSCFPNDMLADFVDSDPRFIKKSFLRAEKASTVKLNLSQGKEEWVVMNYEVENKQLKIY